MTARPEALAAPTPVASVEPPFELRRPAELRTPVIFASPHSGRYYPEDMMAASALDAAEIRRSEDVLVDELIGTAPDLGVPLISARFARAYIDVNREPYELDPSMFEDELPAFARGRSARVAAGLGAIARIVADGQEIYHRKLVFDEARRRIEAVHRPYHAALAGLLEEAKARFGRAVLIDWHSMPSAAAMAGVPRCRQASDFVLGDRFGVACAPSLTALVERELESMAYRVARNTPYAGGYTTEFYGHPRRSIHALQVEINRGLYLEEKSLRRSARFDRLRSDIERLAEVVVCAEPRLSLG